jgi:hypothetical protein
LYKPHIVSLNETKVGEFKANYLIQIDNYTTIHKARSYNVNGGGGVALLIRNDIDFSENKILDDLHLETCVINIKINKMDVNVVSYYNPPHSTLNKMLFEKLSDSKNQYIVLGDLNAKSTQWGAEINNLNGEILNDIVLDNDCLIVNNKEYTHFGFNSLSKSILDYCIISTNLYEMFDSYNVLNNEDMSSDHLPIQLIFNHKSEKQTHIENNNPIKKYNLNKANWDEFKDNLPVEMPLEINNVDELNKFVKDSIIKAADISIPIYTNRVIKGKALPKYVLDLIKLRKKVRKQMIKFRLDEHEKMR